jgi:hypothetical protein
MTAVQPPEQVDDYQLLNVPPELLEEIWADSRARSMSLNNIVCEIMSHRYDLPWTSSDRIPRDAAKDYIYLRLPSAVMDQVRIEAWGRLVTMRSVFLTALSEHYNQTPPKGTRATGSGRPRVKPPRGRKYPK